MGICSSSYKIIPTPLFEDFNQPESPINSSNRNSVLSIQPSMTFEDIDKDIICCYYSCSTFTRLFNASKLVSMIQTDINLKIVVLHYDDNYECNSMKICKNWLSYDNLNTYDVKNCSCCHKQKYTKHIILCLQFCDESKYKTICNKYAFSTWNLIHYKPKLNDDFYNKLKASLFWIKDDIDFIKKVYFTDIT